MFSKILVVCVGNICRSPTGERLLRKYLPHLQIDSAGISALVGRGADAKAIKVAKLQHVELDGHCARQLTKEICREYDLILVMEKQHFDAIYRMAPEMMGKVMLFGHWLDGKDISDPYRKSEEAFQHVYHLLDVSAQKWAQALNR